MKRKSMHLIKIIKDVFNLFPATCIYNVLSRQPSPFIFLLAILGIYIFTIFIYQHYFKNALRILSEEIRQTNKLANNK